MCCSCSLMAKQILDSLPMDQIGVDLVLTCPRLHEFLNSDTYISKICVEREEYVQISLSNFSSSSCMESTWGKATELLGAKYYMKCKEQLFWSIFRCDLHGEILQTKSTSCLQSDLEHQPQHFHIHWLASQFLVEN